MKKWNRGVSPTIKNRILLFFHCILNLHISAWWKQNGVLRAIWCHNCNPEVSKHYQDYF